jgi:uncharacterized protein (TIGR03118 family)
MILRSRTDRIVASLIVLAAAMIVVQTPLAAQTDYQVTNLVSNQAGIAKHQDTQLVNAWGISFAPTGPFWIADNGTGLSTVYTGAGVKESTVVTVPPATGTGKGRPTGTVFNGTTDFVVSQNGHSGAATFLFDTEDGTISGWNFAVNPTAAVIAVNNPGADYTGLAIGSHAGANFLFAADNANNRVDIYDHNFNFVSSFTDTGLPAGSAPFNVQNISGRLVVTFTNSTGGGAVDIFTTGGTLVKSFASGGTLKGPWGLALAPAGFGDASNALIVGNLDDGKINAFNFTTGAFIGQLKDTNNNLISISGLWGLAFGAGSTNNGPKNALFYAAGNNFYADGLFGVINFK